MRTFVSQIVIAVLMILSGPAWSIECRGPVGGVYETLRSTAYVNGGDLIEYNLVPQALDSWSAADLIPQHSQTVIVAFSGPRVRIVEAGGSVEGEVAFAIRNLAPEVREQITLAANREATSDVRVTALDLYDKLIALKKAEPANLEIYLLGARDLTDLRPRINDAVQADRVRGRLLGVVTGAASVFNVLAALRQAGILP